MQPSEINSKSVDREVRLESQRVKYKLHITLRFATRILGIQKSIYRIFKGEDGGVIESSYFSEDFREGNFKYDDLDEGDYLIAEKVFTINENSPKAMCKASEDVDRYIYSFCLKPDIEEVALCVLVPVLSIASIIPRIFLNSYPFQAFDRNKRNVYYNKINYGKCSIILYNFDLIRGNYLSGEKQIIKNKPISKTIVQLSALMSYYVYFYIDMHEQSNWSFFKKDISDSINIHKYVVSKNLPPKTIGKKIWESLTNIPGVSMTAITRTFDFLYNYDGHVRNRIYNRIYDVLDIVYGDKPVDFMVDKIFNLLSEYKEKREDFGLFEFFKYCGYWDYLNDPQLEESCRKWDIARVDGKPIYDAGWWSGYGAVLFTDNEDYIYAFKGTDFDSYGRDWLATNVLQGLTGFSLQHYIASSKAKKYDKQIGSNGSLWFTGHSLGGGLASLATISTESREGITFNAAGLNVDAVKTIQLFKFNSQTIHPNLDRERVTPYRIKGEILDTAQKTAHYVIPVLERGYGKRSVDIEFVGKDINCAARHGINNFLFKEVMLGLTTFEQSNYDDNSTGNNKIVKVYFNGREISMEGKLS